jgi:hypothetical protein
MSVKGSLMSIKEPVVTITEFEMTIVGLLMVIRCDAMKCRGPVATITPSVIVIAGPLMMIPETPIVMTEQWRLIAEALRRIAERRRVWIGFSETSRDSRVSITGCRMSCRKGKATTRSHWIVVPVKRPDRPTYLWGPGLHISIDLANRPHPTGNHPRSRARPRPCER